MPETQPTTLGILGGGQLAQMLVQSAAGLGITVRIYAQNPSDPAALVGDDVSIGRLDDHTALTKFLSRLDVATFESEFVDCTLLQETNRQANAVIRPSLQAIELLQDKLSQKKLCQKLALPTSAFEVLDDQKIPTATDLAKRWPSGCVLKWSRLGYDGKGVLILRDPQNLGAEELQTFIDSGRKHGAQIYVEELIKYSHELAMLATSDGNGKIVFYPLVISEQQDGICKYVRGPAQAFGIDTAVCKSAKIILERLAVELNYCGSFAVEFFLADDRNQQRLLVNEIAPRVHNTGHYSQNACSPDQFKNHLYAIMQQTVETPRQTSTYFGMINVLGPSKVTGFGPSLDRKIPGIACHWYGKQWRPGRKMGHINIYANTAEEFSRLWQLAERIDNHWSNTGHFSTEEALT